MPRAAFVVVDSRGAGDDALLSQLEARRRLQAGGGAGGAGGADGGGGGAAGGGLLKLTATGSRSLASSISKNSRAVKPPELAMTEFGKTWIFVL